MLLNNKEASQRLSSPLNLINQLRNKDKRNSAMSLFGIGLRSEPEKPKEEVKISFNPFEVKTKLVEIPQPLVVIPASTQQETLNDILENNDSQIKLGLAHDKALELLNRSVEMLNTKLDDVRADKLPAVIAAASKTVEGIRKERNEASRNNKDRDVHYHFYTPERKKLTDFEVIEVS